MSEEEKDPLNKFSSDKILRLMSHSADIPVTIAGSLASIYQFVDIKVGNQAVWRKSREGAAPVKEDNPFNAELAMKISSNPKEIECGSIYELLSICNDEHLAPLVKYIMGRPTNSLDVNEDYRRYSPKHTKYYKAIGDEIRLFGGNSLVNLRRGEGPAYTESVDDVCKRLDIPFTKGKTVENEATLLKRYIPKSLNGLSRNEQEVVVSTACDAAGKDVGWGVKKNVLTGLAGRAGAAVLGPLGLGAAAVQSVADPAFEVTAPCVLHIAYLRKLYLDDAAKRSCRSSVPPSNSAFVPVNSKPSVPLVIADEEGGQLLTLACIPEPNLSNWEPVDGSDKGGISRFNPLLQAVPSMATSQEVAATKYMEVVINGPLLKAKGKDGFRCISMVDGKPSHGTLLQPEKLSNIVNAAALWQIASVVVAQKHLADISEKLAVIGKAVENIKQHLEDKRRSLLTGSIRYFEQIAPSVLAGKWSDAYYSQIENSEKQLLQVEDHLLSELQKEIGKTPSLQDSDMFGSEGMQNEIQKHQGTLKNLYQLLFLCLRARACGWQLLAVFPEADEGVIERRKLDIQKTLNRLGEEGDLLRKTDDAMRQKIQNISALTNSNAELNKRILNLLDGNEQWIGVVQSDQMVLGKDIQKAEALVQAQRRPLTMRLKIEGERIVATCSV